MKRLQELIGRQPAAIIWLPDWAERLAMAGISAGDSHVVRRQRLTNIFAVASAFNAASQTLVAAILEFEHLLPVNLTVGAIALALLLVPALHRFGDNVGAHALLVLTLPGIVFTSWVYGRDAEIHVYTTLAGILLFMLGVEHWRRWAGWFLALLVVLAAGLLAPRDGLMHPSPLLQQIFAAQVCINTMVVMTTLIFFALSTLRRQEVELENQYARSAALMNTVFPAPIVERLTSGHEDRIADRVEGLSVLFADLVGFTTATRDLPPEELIDWLDGLVRRLDRLAAEHGVEKIKTIGDCYMAVGGLRGSPQEQAVSLGRLALAMQEELASVPPLAGQAMTFRIGLHTGSATAGVIGDTRFSYDVWGETVNLASRLESHGLPGAVQVSDAFRTLTRGAFSYEERGEIAIRSVGPMRTWLLRARAP